MTTLTDEQPAPMTPLPLPAAKRCRHCGLRRRNKAYRGLCHRCYAQPDVLAHYPVAAVGVGRRPPPRKPFRATMAPPGSQRKLAVLRQRDRDGYPLFHPDDATLDVVIHGPGMVEGVSYPKAHKSAYDVTGLPKAIYVAGKHSLDRLFRDQEPRASKNKQPPIDPTRRQLTAHSTIERCLWCLYCHPELTSPQIAHLTATGIQSVREALGRHFRLFRLAAGAVWSLSSEGRGKLERVLRERGEVKQAQGVA